MYYKIVAEESSTTSLSLEEELYYLGSTEQVTSPAINKDMQIRVLKEQFAVQQKIIDELITEVQEKERQLALSNDLTFEEDAATGKIISSNKHPLERILGYQPGDILDKDITTIFSEQSAEIFKEKRDKGYPLKDFEVMLKHRDGKELIPGRLIMEYNAETRKNTYNIRDISIERLDIATGLPIKTSFCNHFETALYFAPRSKCNLAMVMIDMNNLGHLNNTFGHVLADSVIVEVANLLRKLFTRACDFKARANRDQGDEFYILVSDYGTLENLRHKIKELAQAAVENKLSLAIGVVPISWKDIPVQISEKYIENIITQADNTMHEAKVKIKEFIVPENKKTSTFTITSGFLFAGENPEQTTVIEP